MTASPRTAGPPKGVAGVLLREHAVVANRRRASLRRADGDIPDLPVGGKIAEQHEVPQRVTNRLLVQRRPEDARVEAGGCGRIRHDDVEVLDAEIRKRQRRLRRDALAKRQDAGQEHQSTCDADHESDHAILHSARRVDCHLVIGPLLLRSSNMGRPLKDRSNLAVVKTLTYAMFAMFAMTTDSVGIIIPEVIRTFRLSLTAAGSFQYATMGGIAVAALLLGQLADRIGRRRTIIAGLTLFAAACFFITTVDSFWFFAALLGLSGIAIGVFKTGALALIGDLSSSTTEHTSIMNMLEGFFGIGAIVGPAVLARLLGAGLPWTRLYLLAGAMCAILIVVASLVQYPETARSTAASGGRGTVAAVKNPYVIAFSTAAFLYVGVEAAVYVWMPTLLAGYSGSAAALAAYAVSLFFMLRAAGRFLGAWLLNTYRWQAVLALFSGGILLCFVLAVTGGVQWAVYALPVSGLFMSVIYPTINSKGISCLPKAEHGASAGVILFFTCVSAVLAPLAIGAVSDAFGQIAYGFWMATGFAALLFAGLLLNWVVNPTRAVLERLDLTEYQQSAR